jgi:hypothetical protein
MDKVDARALLDQKVRELRQLSYAELRRPQEPAVFELTPPLPGAAPARNSLPNSGPARRDEFS